MDIATKDQAISPYFLKDAWLDEFGTGPIAVWTIKEDGITKLVIFILAADEERTSPLESEVAHVVKNNLWQLSSLGLKITHGGHDCTS